MTVVKSVLVGVLCAAFLILTACESSGPAPTPPEPESVPPPAPLSALILEREAHNSEFEIVHGGWQCLFHEEPPSGLVLRHVESGSSWTISIEEPWRDLEPGIYQLIVPDTAKGVVGSCARVGTSVDALVDASVAQSEAAARATADLEAGMEAAREEGKDEGYNEGHEAGLRLGRIEGRTSALAEVREEEAAREPAWVNPLVNPDEPAPCEDARKLWLLGQATADGDLRFALRVAVRFRDDGVAWVAVEDDAGGADACHVYSVTDWRYNPETGWLHSGPISVTGY